MDGTWEFLDVVLYKHGEITITVQVVVTLVIVLIATHFILKFARIGVTKRLDEDGKNRFKTVFTFLKYFIAFFVLSFC